MSRFLPSRKIVFQAAAFTGLVVALAASSRPAQAQVVVTPGYPAYTTYTTYGYGYRPYRPARRVLAPAPVYYGGYARPRYYAPRVYAAPVYAPVAPVYAAPARVYGPTVYYPPML